MKSINLLSFLSIYLLFGLPFALSNEKPLVGILEFQNLTDGNVTRIAPGTYKEKNVVVARERETTVLPGRTHAMDTDHYEKQLARDVEYAPGEWSLPPNAGVVASDALASVLDRNTSMALLSRNQISIQLRSDERQLARVFSDPVQYLQLFKDLNADYLLIGRINSFRVDEEKARAYGQEFLKITTKVNVDMQMLNVATGSLVAHFPVEQSVVTQLPGGSSSTKQFDWQGAIRTAFTQASEELNDRISESLKPVGGSGEKVKVLINSEPTGADVEVHGNFVGNTPLEIPLTTGVHAISVTYRDHQTWQAQVKVDGPMEFNAKLEKRPPPAVLEDTKANKQSAD